MDAGGLSPAKDKRAKSTEKTYLSDVCALVNRRLQKRKIRWIEAEKPGAGNTTRNAATGDGWSDEIVELEKAAQLHKQGVLTEEEFQKMKSEILKKKEGEQK